MKPSSSSSSRLKEELDELAKLFPHKEAVRKITTAKPSGDDSAKEGLLTSKQLEYLTPKRAQNMSITLTKVERMPFERMAIAVNCLNPYCELGRDDVAALQLIAPTEDELTSAKECKRRLTACAEEHGEAASHQAHVGLREGERFVLSLLGVPHYDRKLQVILQLMLFPLHIASASESIASLRGSTGRVQASQTLRRCLAICLRVGNALNRGTPRGMALGFDLAVLPTLASVKASNDTSYSLLHFVVSALQREFDAEAEVEVVEVDVCDEVISPTKENCDRNNRPSATTAKQQQRLTRSICFIQSLATSPTWPSPTDLISSIEAQLLKLRNELQFVRSELAQLPPDPPTPTLLLGYPILQPLDHGRAIACFATDEVCTVHWILVPRWRRPPTMSTRGKEHTAPRPVDILKGRCRDGSSAIVSGSIVMREAERMSLVLFEGLPRSSELSLYAVAADTFGWLGEAEEGVVAEAAERGKHAMGSWHFEAIEMMKAARAKPLMEEAEEEGGEEDDDKQVACSVVTRGEVSKLAVAQSTPAFIELGTFYEVLEDGAGAPGPPLTLGERRSALRACLRTRHCESGSLCA